MNAAASTELNTGLPARSEGREARRWIECQLRWEHTLGALRNQRSEGHEARAA